MALGMALECVQAALPYRSFDVLDMLANASGVLIGWAVAPPRTANAVRWLQRTGSRRYRDEAGGQR
ncbi:MAG TPA: VanZ family protein [Burkholderiales bacterium]|nr:VanZ family protein [Burkholderiales bacterium]